MRTRDRVTTTVIVCAIFLTMVVGLISVRAMSQSATATETASRATSRRSITIDALNAYQEQRACESATFAEFDSAIADVILTSQQRGTPEQLAAVDKLNVARDHLRTMQQRCIDDHPIPVDVDTGTAPTAPS